MKVNCENCGSAFNKKPAEVARTRNNFCSKKCSGIFRMKKTENEFWSKTEANGECLEWNGAKNKDGYGIQRFRKKIQLAHRVSYIISKGEIDECLCVLHRCDNPCCVNPDHLWLGSQKDNMDDMSKKGRRYKKMPLPSPPND